jgi:hypothetical protein
VRRERFLEEMLFNSSVGIGSEDAKQGLDVAFGIG